MQRLLDELDSRDDKGVFFERLLVPWLLKNVPALSAQYPKVWHWSENPDAGTRDLGIDLVIEDRKGDRFAVQAKCFSKHHSHSWRELATFVGDASTREEISGLILFSTAPPFSVAVSPDRFIEAIAYGF